MRITYNASEILQDIYRDGLAPASCAPGFNRKHYLNANEVCIRHPLWNRQEFSMLEITLCDNFDEGDWILTKPRLT